jgi:hypothetical protein
MHEPGGERKEPFVRITRREPVPAFRAWPVRLAAVVLALMTAASSCSRSCTTP